jgi:hypothetical protein
VSNHGPSSTDAGVRRKQAGRRIAAWYSGESGGSGSPLLRTGGAPARTEGSLPGACRRVNAGSITGVGSRAWGVGGGDAGPLDSRPHVVERAVSSSPIEVEEALEGPGASRRRRLEIDLEAVEHRECAGGALERPVPPVMVASARTIERLGGMNCSSPPAVVVNSLSPSAAVRVSVPVAVAVARSTMSSETAVKLPRCSPYPPRSR